MGEVRSMQGRSWGKVALLVLVTGMVAGCVVGNDARMAAVPVAAADLQARPVTGDFIARAEAELAGIRSTAGLGPMRFDPALATAAAAHAGDMAAGGFRSHTGSDGSTFVTRARRAGASCASGEVITWGADTVAGAFAWWMGSPEHRGVLLRPGNVSFGLAEVNRIWVLVAGRC
jgi:uncharacterized protein YkwD